MKISIALRLCSFASCLLAINLAVASDELSTTPTKQQILDCVKRFTGLTPSFVPDKTERVSLAGLNIPFLTSQIKEKIGIRVQFTPGKINWIGIRSGVTDSNVRHFSVYLDADAKRVLAVTSALADRSPDIHPEPSPETAETEMRKMGIIYDSFPAIDPKVTFMDALPKVRSGSPIRAQEIDGFYVMYKTAANQLIPAWIIHMRGLPPRPFRDPFKTPNEPSRQPPVWTRNYGRDVVNAITGEWILGGNWAPPQ